MTPQLLVPERLKAPGILVPASGPGRLRAVANYRVTPYYIDHIMDAFRKSLR